LIAVGDFLNHSWTLSSRSKLLDFHLVALVFYDFESPIQMQLQNPSKSVVSSGANISFMVALVLTTASSAMTLEQLTPVFIAGGWAMGWIREWRAQLL
jgi:hypothetical protein